MIDPYHCPHCGASLVGGHLCIGIPQPGLVVDKQDYRINLVKYKSRWLELKVQIDHEIEQAELGLIAACDTVSFPHRSGVARYTDEIYHEGMLVELRKMRKIMQKLEEF